MDDLYSEARPKDRTPAGPEEEDEADGAPTAVVSLDVLKGPDGEAPKEGEEIVVRVVKVYGDEAEVEYAPKHDGESEDEEDTQPKPRREMSRGAGRGMMAADTDNLYE